MIRHRIAFVLIALVMVLQVGALAVLQGLDLGMGAQEAEAAPPMDASMNQMDQGAASQDVARTGGGHAAMKHVTQAEREAAADRARLSGLGAPSTAGLMAPEGAGVVTSAMDPLGVPDMFGTIPHYALSPLPQIQGLGAARDYYGAWYDSQLMTNWVLMSNPSGATVNLTFNLSIANNAKVLPDAFGQGSGVVPGGNTLPYIEPGTMGGPVKATSTNGGQALISQRTLRGSSFEEVVTSESTRLSDHFYWPWYDSQTAGYQNWIVIDNPSASDTVHVVITMNDDQGSPVTLGESDILPNSNWTPIFPGNMGGPVELKASLSGSTWPTNPRDVVASQRVLSNFGTAFNEMPGIPADELHTSYIWTWYDMTGGMQNWILLANPDPNNAVDYEIKIGGVVPGGGTGSIPAGQVVAATFPGTMDGPVEVTGTATGTGDGKLIASQRIVFGPSFGEVAGYSTAAALPSDYQWTWYDMQSAASTNWVLIGNPDAVNPITYNVTIAGVPVGSGTVAAGDVTPLLFPGQMGGPVRLTTSGPAIASQRVLWNGYFNEVVGTGGIVPAGGVVPGSGIRKFVDTLPLLDYGNRNNLNQYIPVADPAPCPVGNPGDCDYYEISLVEYTEQMHTDLPATTLRGYKQTNSADPNVTVPHYLGPMIVAQRDKPVRVKFTNELPVGAAGDLFIPTDTSIMGSGEGPKNPDGSPCDPTTETCADYTQNRASVHLHGGATPWISDGTPHQWITPAGETTPYPEGVSVQNVPDMPDPGAGSMTFYYTNEQS
ncbi:MAG: hypothetical protein AB1760_17660, partial [Pseudomonadota bacterium]